MSDNTRSLRRHRHCELTVFDPGGLGPKPTNAPQVGESALAIEITQVTAPGLGREPTKIPRMMASVGSVNTAKPAERSQPDK
jgi:hypothetical protein